MVRLVWQNALLAVGTAWLDGVCDRPGSDRVLSTGRHHLGALVQPGPVHPSRPRHALKSRAFEKFEQPCAQQAKRLRPRWLDLEPSGTTDRTATRTPLPG
jgi:hypothetical protein